MSQPIKLPDGRTVKIIKVMDPRSGDYKSFSICVREVEPEKDVLLTPQYAPKTRALDNHEDRISALEADGLSREDHNRHVCANIQAREEMRKSIAALEAKLSEEQERREIEVGEIYKRIEKSQQPADPKPNAWVDWEKVETIAAQLNNWRSTTDTDYTTPLCAFDELFVAIKRLP